MKKLLSILLISMVLKSCGDRNANIENVGTIMNFPGSTVMDKVYENGDYYLKVRYSNNSSNHYDIIKVHVMKYEFEQFNVGAQIPGTPKN